MTESCFHFQLTYGLNIHQHVIKVNDYFHRNDDVLVKLLF